MNTLARLTVGAMAAPLMELQDRAKSTKKYPVMKMVVAFCISRVHRCRAWRHWHAGTHSVTSEVRLSKLPGATAVMLKLVNALNAANIKHQQEGFPKKKHG